MGKLPFDADKCCLILLDALATAPGALGLLASHLGNGSPLSLLSSRTPHRKGSWGATSADATQGAHAAQSDQARRQDSSSQRPLGSRKFWGRSPHVARIRHSRPPVGPHESNRAIGEAGPQALAFRSNQSVLLSAHSSRTCARNSNRIRPPAIYRYRSGHWLPTANSPARPRPIAAPYRLCEL